MKNLILIFLIAVIGAGCMHGPFLLDELSPSPKWATDIGDGEPYTVQFYRQEPSGRIKAVVKHGQKSKKATRWGHSITYRRAKKPDSVSKWVIDMGAGYELYKSAPRSTVLFLDNLTTNDLTDKSILEIASQRKEEELQLLTSEPRRFYALDDVAMSAFYAGKYEKAAKYAHELLTLSDRYRKNWNYGRAVHKGNLLLGKIALNAGDIAKAKKHLLASGETSGSSALNTFRPNMSLARDLLREGEIETVIKYLDLVDSFWRCDTKELDNWKKQIAKGFMPDF